MPRRRYQASLVMNPMWANWVEASIGPPPPQVSPTSAAVMAAI